MIELEKTYLAKSLPADLTSYPSKQIIDIYIPASSHHPTLRIRKNGDSYEITKKSPISEGDASEQTEHTIALTEAEYQILSSLKGKRIEKIRYLYRRENRQYEFDIFQGDLAGLILVDVEFSTSDEKITFTMPDFCLADVTQEDFIAGGMLCGKTYQDIAPILKKFTYTQLFTKK